APSKRSDASFTSERKRARSSPWVLFGSKRRTSYQALLMESHISPVSAVRTARALVRAVSTQFLIDAGLAGEKARNSVTVRASALGWVDLNAAEQPAVANADCHSLEVAPVCWGMVASRWAASTMRDRLSARSMKRASQ